MHKIPRALAALGLAALLGLPTAANAADDVSITHVQTTETGIQVLVAVPPGAQVDMAGVNVTIDGQEAPATAESAGGAAVERTTVLVIDTSKSMDGERFEAAKAAADAYLSSVPADVKVGVVTFAREVVPALPPTTDRESARQVVQGLTLTRQTRLYEGIMAATELAGSEGQRSLLVLSDGADTSKTPLSDAIGAISNTGVLVDVVSLEQEGDLGALAQLSNAGGGEVISAETDVLAAAFSEEAEILARQVLVTAELPAGTATESTITVTLPANGQTLTAEVFAPVREGAAPRKTVALPSVDSGMVLPDWGIWLALALIGTALLVFLGTLFAGFGKKELSAEERVALYAGMASGQQPAAKPGMTSEQTFAQARGAAEAVLNRSKSLEERITTRLQAADSGFRASEWLLVHTGIIFVAGLAGVILGGGSLFFGLFFIILGFIGPWMYLGFLKRRRFKKFNAALPDTLQLMSGSLAAGLSLAQSVDTIVREGTEPIASEFKRVLVETRLGVSLEDALQGITDRFDSKDFGWVVMAIKIQRQVGGNLAELLDTVAGTIREREYMRRQVQALAAEGKISAYVLGGLPPGFLVYLILTKPDYVGVLFEEPLGWAMLAGAGLLLAVGAFWMSRLIKVEV